MKIVPVIVLKDGIVEPGAQVRTFARAQEAMIDASVQSAPEPAQSRFIVTHTNAPEIAGRVAARLRERLGTEPKYLRVLEAGPVIATHAGAGAVGIFSVYP